MTVGAALQVADVDGFAGHPWHHYWGGGPESLVVLALPLVAFAMFVGSMVAVRWLLRRAASTARRRLSARARPVVSALTRSLPASRVLASDRERDETVARLSAAAGEGRLSLDEASERTERALLSRHRHELAALVADLPAAAPTALPAHDGWSRVRRDLAVFALCALVAAAVVQGAAGAWALWPLTVASFAALALLPGRPRRRGAHTRR
ncbi:MAG: DUF1707 SHOCT-like domain-containing protein [Acidimicrobiales bacterium]